jgi:lysophospholipase L1-like esterase
MRSRHSTLIAAGTTLALALVVGGFGTARASGSVAAAASSTKASLTPVTAKFSYRIESRVDKAWDAWRSDDEQYASSYANPISWTLMLDGCASSGSRKITNYEWKIQRLVADQSPVPPTVSRSEVPSTLSGASCSRNVMLRELGAYRIWLTVKGTDGTSNTTSKSGTFRDLLVVSIGDSLSSGEGNADKNGAGNFVPPVWTNQQCHRSAKSWSAHVARWLENSLTAVTFLNYACSGAELRHLYADGYYGIEKGNLLLPQLEAVRNTLGDPTVRTTRRVDALLVTIGINDLGFSSLLDSCAHSFTNDCTTTPSSTYTRKKLRELPGRYDRLDSAIGTSVRASRVYLAELPARLFTDSNDRHGGCGAFEAGMRSDEAHWISDRGDELNSVMRSASQRNGWAYISGIRDKFRGHGYCADDDDTWFRSYTGSKKLQGNDRGTAHPNPDGHRAIADVASTFVSADGRASLPPQRIHIRVNSVRLDNTSSAAVRNRCNEDRDSPLLGEDRWVALCQRVRLVAPNAWEQCVTGSGVVRRGESGTRLPIGRTVVLSPPLEFDVDTYSNTIVVWASSRVLVDNAASWNVYTGGPLLPTELVEASIVLRRSDRWRPAQTTVTGTTVTGPNKSASLRIEVEATPVDPGPGALAGDPRASQ